jgi:hypothetical protein
MALLLFMTLAAWSMGSAVGSSPDEDYVLTSIWCGTEGNPPHCRKDPDDANAMIVPFLVSKGSTCYLSQGNAFSAKCDASQIELKFSTNSYNSFNQYPKLYFAIARIFVSPFVEASVVKIRLFNSLIASLLITFGFSLRSRLRTDEIIAWLGVVAPTTLYFISSVNTSSWSLIGITAFSFGLISLLRDQKTWISSVFTYVYIFVAVFISISSRSETKFTLLLLTTIFLGSRFIGSTQFSSKKLYQSFSYWLIFMLLFFVGKSFLSNQAPNILVIKDPRLKWIALALVALFSLTNFVQKILRMSRKYSLGFGALTGLFFIIHDQSSQKLIAIDILNDSRFELDNGIKTTAFNLLINNIIDLPRFILGFLGSWGLGWFDIEMTAAVWLFALQAFLLIFIFSLRKLTTPHRVLVSVSLGLMCLAILYANQQTFTPIGQVIQPRYFLPFFLGIVIIAAANKTERYPNSLVITVAILATISNSIALRDTIRRYTTGQDVFISKSLNNPIEWWWQFGPQPETVWLTGTLAFAALWAILIYDRNKEELNAPNSPTPELAS